MDDKDTLLLAGLKDKKAIEALLRKIGDYRKILSTKLFDLEIRPLEFTEDAIISMRDQFKELIEKLEEMIKLKNEIDKINAHLNDDEKFRI